MKSDNTNEIEIPTASESIQRRKDEIRHAVENEIPRNSDQVRFAFFDIKLAEAAAKVNGQ